MKDKVIIITGPTASGKSSLALKVAEEIGGEIISADSQQVYREMNIGTNKVSQEELSRVKHYCLDLVDPDQEFSVQDFSIKARKKITEINKKGKIPIVTGGTGFYIDSILFDMNYGSTAKNDTIRKELEELSETKDDEYLYNKLEEIDPETAKKYHPNEKNRIIRALEIYKISGEKPSEVRKGSKKLNDNINPMIFFINYEDRQVLYEKINKRVNMMVDEGLIEEFNYLINKYKLTRENQAMKAIGYKEVFDYVEGCASLDETIELIQRNTRRYAKRQITWMKKYLEYDFTRYILKDQKEKDEIIKYIKGEIDKKYGLQWVL